MSDSASPNTGKITDEIPTAEKQRGISLVLVVFFLLTLGAIPLVQQIIEVRAELREGRKISLLPKAFSHVTFPDMGGTSAEPGHQRKGFSLYWERIREFNGEALRQINDVKSRVDEDSWLLKSVAPAVEKLLVGVFGAATTDVYRGRDGWLFFRPTLEYLTGPGFLDPAVLKRRLLATGDRGEVVQPDPVRAIVDFRDQLARRGIELVVLPAPAKASVYPEKFSSRYGAITAPLQNPSYTEFAQRLATKGVRLFDPASILIRAKGKDDLFLKTDTHWSPAGADLVARELAAYLGREGLLSATGPVRYRRTAQPAENGGDLAKMLRMSQEDGFGLQRVEIRQVSTHDGSPWKPSRNADILFLGDSYANIFSLEGMGWGKGSGFVEQLAFHLQRPLDAILINDKGSFTTRQQLGNELKRGDDRLAGKKVVIYEFAARELALGNWKQIDLALGKKIEPMPVQAGNESMISSLPAKSGVEGVVEEITQPPRPGSTAYKDAVIAIHLKDVTVGGRPFSHSQIVVFAWGMRDNQISPSSRYRRGQRVSLQVRPWSEVEQKYGSYQRIELSNDEAVVLPLYWLIHPDDEKGVPVTALPVSTERAAPPPADVAEKNPALTGGKPTGPADTDRAKVPFSAATFQERVREIVNGMEQDKARVFSGSEGWLFSKQELVHLAKGEFWGEAAQTTSVATKPENRDPLPAILDFKQQLDSAGIELILVPVPAKAHIYPDRLIAGIRPDQVGSGTRPDPVHQQFLAMLGNAGVEYLDVTKLFLDARNDGGPPAFLRKDTHWSPSGMTLVARALKSKIDKRPWFQAAPRLQFTKVPEKINIKGDLTDNIMASLQGMEEVTISRVFQVEDGRKTAVASDRHSPILLIGDSHTLIFHSGGDMHAEGAGFPENLAYELGMKIDLVGVRGSGATPARIELVRRRDNLKGKKLVIWCFTVREYTESPTGWQKLSVIRQPKTGQ